MRWYNTTCIRNHQRNYLPVDLFYEISQFCEINWLLPSCRIVHGKVVGLRCSISRASNKQTWAHKHHDNVPKFCWPCHCCHHLEFEANSESHSVGMKKVLLGLALQQLQRCIGI